MKKNIIDKLNKGLEKIFATVNKDYINCIGRCTDLKLHNIICSDLYNDDDFNNFCYYAFNDYEDFENTLSVKREYIHLSSKFYILPSDNILNFFDIQYLENRSYKEKILYLLDIFVNTQIDYSLSINDLIIIDNNKITDIGNFATEFVKDYCNYFYANSKNIDDIINEFINDFNKFINDYFEDVWKLYDYIDDFKKNQMQYYKDYITNIA